ncbi:telomere repeats-binding bouquet formation protein 2 isoform X1 [Neopelma chrysocephalum]|uniref:telomere repeats-binding bouquet formation protein 2 isoform X1 n=1 Tax=Neopelma chrysocephalum TaxID=114329 RepID=UPI000FCD0DA4|nr:telomere repeats-binding bouquet formation protein 2 isoform X1 [Neopelma chrysocephalum]XP_027553853.1 telomere repeats-binding bouquet formation protein 2 isoform X1 [Neopelma chrysocephalum]
MFRGRRAWFSQSVSPGPRGLWVTGGGALTDWLDAEYLFSSDATHPDTRSIHESLRYLEGRATVFHSRYLSACERAGTTEKPSVVLGHFILPPACLQEEIRRKIGCFIWEQVDVLEEKPKGNPTEEAEAARNGCEEEPEGEALDLDKSSEETGSEVPSQGEFPYRALQKYPVNNMVTGYTSSRDMKKYEGELHDFIPGMSGYTAYWVQTKISIYCERKTKMKRKL